MTTLLNACPVPIDICVSRGDTRPFSFLLTSSGSARTITGFTYTLTVDTLENPTDTNTNVFALTGSVSSTETGVVSFAMTTSQADQSPTTPHFFDVQETDGASDILTIIKGKYTFDQDITKS